MDFGTHKLFWLKNVRKVETNLKKKMDGGGLWGHGSLVTQGIQGIHFSESAEVMNLYENSEKVHFWAKLGALGLFKSWAILLF